MDFKEQMKKEFIPAIEEMLEKESAHLAYMIESRGKVKKICSSMFFADTYTESDMDHMIERSKQSIGHFRQRIIEYTEYANKP